jgi:CRP-like cAMP-binding protein
MPSNPLAPIAKRLTGKLKRAATAGAVPDVAAVATQWLSEKLGYLSAMKIFQDLSREELLEVERATTMINCNAGRVFYIPGETGEVLFLLKKGRVQIYCLSPEGRKLTVKILEPMTFFGEMAILGQGMHNTFAEALDDCLICVMSRQDVKRLLLSNPRVAARICEELASRMVETERRLEEFVFKDVEARVAALLVRLAGEGNEVIGYTHQELADLLGVYRETVTHALDRLKTRGLINIQRKRIKLLNRAELTEISGAPLSASPGSMV